MQISFPYTAGDDIGYWLGVAGTTFMFSILFYSMRKRFSFMSRMGSMRAWFAFHIFAGVVGPLLILAHTTLRFGSMNAIVAFSCMVSVALSGMVGRFLMRWAETSNGSLFSRLVSVWHVVHYPFLLLLGFSTIAHIVAVHMY